MSINLLFFEPPSVAAVYSPERETYHRGNGVPLLDVDLPRDALEHTIAGYAIVHFHTAVVGPFPFRSAFSVWVSQTRSSGCRGDQAVCRDSIIDSVVHQAR
ncbi:hypothetical protein [Halocatena pleomorpha]|uniref:Uncharacterized protein n=1 Tax=Halocatena pleomorpha TaxID=1785090 RepID=A0A3P3R389_9EURY|nr:hypothetical protein [Halocatena pleomorpha]RRJ27815.1 hypothetical protein EIK79_17180 [Halocatena pleomorpha]